uniref:Uncharacterized protein n=1 Tax=Glossina palpalis gambiensis TaxID=67801 RepID=A0A1B0ATJ8_9MUSC
MLRWSTKLCAIDRKEWSSKMEYPPDIAIGPHLFPPFMQKVDEHCHVSKPNRFVSPWIRKKLGYQRLARASNTISALIFITDGKTKKTLILVYIFTFNNSTVQQQQHLQSASSYERILKSERSTLEIFKETLIVIAKTQTVVTLYPTRCSCVLEKFSQTALLNI